MNTIHYLIQTVHEIKALTNEIAKNGIKEEKDMIKLIKTLANEDIFKFIEDSHTLIGVLDMNGKLDASAVKRRHPSSYPISKILKDLLGMSTMKETEDYFKNKFSGNDIFDSYRIDLCTDAGVQYGELVLFRIL